jgi:hypothetical protein
VSPVSGCTTKNVSTISFRCVLSFFQWCGRCLSSFLFSMLDSFAPLQMILDNVRCSQILQHYIGGFYVCFEIYWRSSVQGFGAWNKCFMLAVIAVNIRQHLDLCKGWELAPAHVLYSTCHSLKQMCTAAAPVPFVFWNFKNLLFLASEAQCNDSHQEYMFKENLRNCEPIDLSRFVVDLRKIHLELDTLF